MVLSRWLNLLEHNLAFSGHLSMFNNIVIKILLPEHPQPGAVWFELMQRQRRGPKSGSRRINRTAIIGFRVEPHVKAAAERAAARDRRTLSSLMEKLLVEFLSAEGFLA
jgi:hypothetical protein